MARKWNTCLNWHATTTHMDEHNGSRHRDCGGRATVSTPYLGRVPAGRFCTLQAPSVHPLWTTSLMYLLATLALLGGGAGGPCKKAGIRATGGAAAGLGPGPNVLQLGRGRAT